MLHITFNEGVDVFIDDITREIKIQTIIPDLDIKNQKDCAMTVAYTTSAHDEPSLS